METNSLERWGLGRGSVLMMAQVGALAGTKRITQIKAHIFTFLIQQTNWFSVCGTINYAAWVAINTWLYLYYNVVNHIIYFHSQSMT